MASQLEQFLHKAEDAVRRHVLRSGAARQAQKRRFRRRLDEMLRRLRRAGLLFAGLLAALVLASVLIGPIGLLTWLVAIPTAFLIAFLSIFVGAGRRPAAPAASAPPDLPALAVRAEEWLLDRCDALPGRALPAADAILARLGELQPHLAALDPDSLEAGEARRLIGAHLPRLVDAYLALPESARAPGSESGRDLADSLETLAGELDDLLERCCRDRRFTFETQRRFIETRYREDGRLRSD